MRPLRIGIACHHSIGGSTKVGLDLANALGERGHDVHLFSRRPPLGMHDFAPGVTLHAERDGGTPTHRLDSDWTPADVESFAARIAAAGHLDLVHFHYAVPFADVASRLRANGCHAPMIVTLHGTDVTGPRNVGPALAALDAVTTVSRTYAALARARFALPAAPDVIPNFVDTRVFRPAPARRRGRPVVVHVSNFRPVKDAAMLARVFLRVREQVDAELWLVGDGEEMPAAQRALADAPVRCFGLRRSVAEIVARADVFVLTSRSESFSLAALEAAACGVPVVAPAVGGLPEVVADGRTGILFEPGDDAGAAGAVVRLLIDEALRAELGGEAVRHVQSFTRERIVPRYEALYRRLLLGRRVAQAPRLVP